VIAHLPVCGPKTSPDTSGGLQGTLFPPGFIVNSPISVIPVSPGIAPGRPGVLPGRDRAIYSHPSNTPGGGFVIKTRPGALPGCPGVLTGRDFIIPSGDFMARPRPGELPGHPGVIPGRDGMAFTPRSRIK